jgi:Fic family protein
MVTYTVTKHIRRCLARIETLRAELDRVGPLPRIWMGRTRQDLEAEAVAASTRMEGVAVTVDEARRILVGDVPSGVTPENAALVDGYREAMRYVLARADDPNFSWHTELLLAIHHRVLAGSHARRAGRLRVQQNWVTNRETGEQVYLPPPAAHVPELTDELLAWLSDFDGPVPVAAAVAHVSLAAIHPFRDGNGRTARVVASLVMCRAGYHAPYFTSLEEWWGRHLPEYYAAFGCLGDLWQPTRDVTPFVAAHVCAQTTQVEALSLRQATDRSVWTVLADMAVHDLSLAERTTHALYDAFLAREVTNRYYRGLADVSDVTASHDLGKLVAAGVLGRRGAGRRSHYVSTQRLYRAVARGAGLEERVVAAGASRTAQRDAVLTALAGRLHGGVGRDASHGEASG